jgi:hypothetical protein
MEAGVIGSSVLYRSTSGLPSHHRSRLAHRGCARHCRLIRLAKSITRKGEIMPQYLLANYLPDDFDPSTMTEATVRAINDLNDELEAAGARLMACGLSPASQAKSVRGQPNGKPHITDGPYLETKEHIGGFWILEAADMEEALTWARKAAFDSRSRGEVREIPYSSLSGGTPHPSRVKP